MSVVTAENPSETELIENELYDPTGPHADQTLELLRFLISLGATLDDLVEYRNELPGLGTIIVARPGRPHFTRAEVAERSGISEEFLARLWRAAGFPEPSRDAAVFSEPEGDVVRLSRALASSSARRRCFSSRG